MFWFKIPSVSPQNTAGKRPDVSLKISSFVEAKNLDVSLLCCHIIFPREIMFWLKILKFVATNVVMKYNNVTI